MASILALLSVAGLACGGEEPTTAPVATQAPAATQAPEPTAAPPTAMPAADQEVFKLKFSSPVSPPPFLISEVQKWWADEVENAATGASSGPTSTGRAR